MKEFYLSVAEVELEEELNQEIMEEGIPPPSPNAIHYYVNSMQDPNSIGEDADVKLEPPTQENIFNFLRMFQKVVIIRKTRAEPLMDYSQSQILTSREHVESLHNIGQKRATCTRKKSKEGRKVAYQAC